VKVAVVGAAGYAGGELLRILLQHPEVSELVATSRSQAGKAIGEVLPQLSLLTDARFAALSPAEAAGGRDVVFLALEHGESSRVMGDVVDAGPGMIVDIAADFRIRNGRLHAAYYGEHPAPALVHRFSYGLADVVGEALRGATGIAAPGCFATSAQLALFGIADLQLAAPPVVFAVTGSSGAGQTPRPTTHHPARAGNLFAYSPMSHRHEGEILEQWRTWRNDANSTARLMTHSGPFVRGIHATLHAHLAGAAGIQQGINEHLRARFAGRPFVRVLDRPPQLSDVVGSNLAALHAVVSPEGREVQVMCVIDNLIKGAGGQAVQAMNLALGIPETSGLTAPGPMPC
jgi:N-acetyl-gamma-glutamyl-phosphate/LysW-gamma-L-alpha-aminoadipyl-6-phosphate reductase